MIGNLNFKNKTATIVGAGVSGLLIAYKLKRLGFEVEILEAGTRVGGLLHTLQTPFGMVEKAAHSLLVSRDVSDFLQELGLKLVPVNHGSKSRFIVRGGKIRRMPLNFREIVSTLRHIFKKPTLTKDLKSLSFAEWGQGYLGPAATEYFLNPFTTGIFACSPDELIASLAFPILIPESSDHSLFKHIRSLKKRKKRSERPVMMALENGMQSLTDALANELRGQIKLNTPLQSFDSLSAHGNVILSTPATVTAKLLETVDPTSSALLKQIRYTPLVSVTAFFDRSAFARTPPKGMGFLVPKSQGHRVLGCLFNSSAFPNRANGDLVSLTIMLGGSGDPHAAELSDSEIQNIITNELSKLIGLKSSAKHLEITRHLNAIPVFDLTLQKCRNTLRDGYCSQDGRIVFSNFSANISIRGMIESLCQIHSP
ncbi:MAG: protoporphyrinogen oxidase [Bdellovibrionales bacterium]|nr:protoporphyrinogen oxidase [Bdellovibrionales bacterium]